MQYPFNHNDARKKEDRELGIYHFAPISRIIQIPFKKLNFNMSLDDLNTSNHLVRDALRENYGYWIQEVGLMDSGLIHPIW